ncbi:ATP-binding cassette domain-containing protein [Agromyces mediolanus]|uniref:ABC transporter ATP-binding protein n=1 Tax=Agromyces mediolanus TaxID=41986 RepID=A0A918F9M5_AGRME|nr:ABC transporter ATP-binding protein [Agromyces mediolanus]GGR14351.1 ABC transporter ATP-binding protein [Agromyces mediolanus]GLJ72772.1 ABC transporter ATP-binding protein [Agromyces mediolanus]
MTGIDVALEGIEGPAGRMVEPLSFGIAPAASLALIGESGSGKTLTAKSLVGLLPPGFRAAGTLRVDGREHRLEQTDASWRAVRGREVSLLLQDPFTSLSPVHRCGPQIAWTLEAKAGRRLPARELEAEVARRLAEVNLPARVARAHPHELSGGMRQRVAIAAALASDPRLLIADEPTTALDASNQAEILDLLRELQHERGMAMLLISHDLGLVRGRTDEVLVMRHGEVVERGDTARVLSAPEHQYTKALIAADPALALDAAVPAEASGHSEASAAGASTDASDAPPLVRAAGVVKRFGERTVLGGVDLDIAAGEIVGIVGESGSGKSTLARCIAGLEREDGGTIAFDGAMLAPGRRSRTPGQMQIVFQDPYSSLNPMMTIGQILREALAVGGRAAAEVPGLLETVGLPADAAAKRPAQLSGGQRQRVAIARALAPRPRLLICDESVSALDVQVQAQILELLGWLREELGVAILFISHDLAVVRRIADTVTVVWQGRVVERGPCARVLDAPVEEYTKLLVAAAHRDRPPRHDHTHSHDHSTDGRTIPA